MERWLRIAALVLLAGAAACGGGGTSTPDAEDDAGDTGDAGDVEDVEDATDAPPDGADADDGDVEPEDGADADDGADTGPETKRTAITLTAGGGRASSPNYRLTLSVGTPQPMGSAAAGTRRIEIGPGAVQNQ